MTRLPGGTDYKRLDRTGEILFRKLMFLLMKPREKNITGKIFLLEKKENAYESSKKHVCFPDGNFASETRFTF